MTDLSEYRALFLEELDEQLQYIEEEVLRLEHEGATDTAVDRLFRAAHTLKGSSAAMGYHKMKEVTHQLEHLLHQVRNGERTVTKPLINLMFTGLDVMKGLQAEIVRTDAETSDISPLLQQLQQFSMNAASESVIPEPPNAFSGGAKEELPGDAGQPPAQRSVYTETKSKSQTIRVNIERLDHLMNLAGELVIDQTRIQQVNTLFRQRFGSDDLVEELFQLSDHLSLLIGELQDGVMKARMLPIEQLYNRFPRMIRDLAESLGKQVDLILQGKDTELDRTLIEEIGDPLIHLLRNAVDHGIEAPEQRRLSGKSERGSTGIIKGMQENTRASVKSVQESAELSERTGESFGHIVSYVNDAGQKVAEIAAASEQQAAQTATVLSAVENISATTQEAAASSEETAATAQSLAQLAEELQRSVSVFKL